MNSNINWGTVVVRKNRTDIVSVAFFKNSAQKIEYINKANSLVKEYKNRNNNAKHQVSIHYGCKPLDIIRLWQQF